MLVGADIKSIPGFFLRVLVDGMNAGCYWLIWKGTAVEAHTALLENCRGRKAITATKAAIAWVFGHTSATEIRSYAWSDAPAVAWFCRAVGLRHDRTEPWHATRGGKPVDIMWFNLMKEEI